MNRHSLLRNVSPVLLSVLGLLGACSPTEPPRGTAVAVEPSARLVRGNGPEPDSLDPQRARNVESANVLRDLYEGLTTLDRSGAPAPGAATDWQVSDDGLRWTFRLRSGLRWSNGDPLVAGDFVAALRRLANPATRSQYAQVIEAIRHAPRVFAGQAPPEALGVSAPDATTVVIELATPVPYLPGLMAHSSTMPIHGPSLARHGGDFVKPGNHVTNGAFRLASWVQGSHLDLERNRNYWNDAANRIDAVRWVSQADENAEYRLYRSGELHVTNTVPRGLFEQLRHDHPNELRIGPQLGTYFIGFNLDREPFRSQPGLRRALSLVIDRERLTRSITRVGELPAYGWVPPGTFNYTSQSFDYVGAPQPQRLAEARRLYAAAGYSAARPLRFGLRYSNGEVHSRIALAIADMWKEALGVESSLVAVEFKVLQQDIDARTVDLFRLSWIGDYNDAWTFLQYFKSDFGINTVHFADQRYDALLAQAASEVDATRRRTLLEAAERRLLEQHALIPIYFYVNKHLVSPRVSGWYDNVMNVVYSRDLALGP